MPAPVLLVVAGTRSEVLECYPLVHALRQAPRYSLPFETRFLVTGQEDTELQQTLDALELDPDEDLGVKTSHVADAALAARLLGDMEAALRHHAPAAIVAAGPVIQSAGGQLPYASLGATVLGMLVLGMLWIALAGLLALRGERLGALRSE